MMSPKHLKKNIDALSKTVNRAGLFESLSRVERALPRCLERSWMNERPIAIRERAEVVCLGTAGIAPFGPLLGRVSKVVIVEPDLERVARVLAREDLSASIRAGEVELLIDVDAEAVVAQWVPAQRKLGAGKLLLIDGAGDDSERKSYFQAVLAGITARERDHALDTGAMVALGSLAVGNALENLARIDQPFPERLWTHFRDRPAVILSAGPSLDANLDHLEDISGRALVVAVDTAVKPLLARGLLPDVVVGVDPRERNVHNLRGVPLAETFLIAELSSHPALSAGVGSGRAFVLAEGAIGDALHKLPIDVPSLSMYGSVATAAFELVCRMGADPIVLMGQDLAFTDGRQYGADVDRRSSVAPSGDEMRSVEDIHGRQVQTTERLLSFRDWLETRMTQLGSSSGRTFINATGAGILKRGAKSVDAAKLAGHYLTEPFDARAALADSFASAGRSEARRGVDAVERLRQETGDCLEFLSRSRSRDTGSFLAAYSEYETVAGLVEVLSAETLRALAADWNRLPELRRQRKLKRVLESGVRSLDAMVTHALELAR